jgi:superfamily II DNA or RNA helicase
MEHVELCNKVLSYRGYNIAKDIISPDDLKNIKSELTVSPYIPEGYNQAPVLPFKLYQESSKRIYVPKCYGLKRFGMADMDKIAEGVDIQIEFNGKLRDYQEEPVCRFMNAAHDPCRRGGILNVYCGFGKTNLAIYIMCMLKKKTIILCHKDFLLQQWKERIEVFAPAAKVGLLKAKVIDIEDKDVVLASLQSVAMKEYDADIFKEFGFLIADESHHLPAEVFSQALRKINCKYSLGLTATLQRKDGLSKVLKWYIGDVVFKATKRNDQVQVNMLDYYDPNPSYSLECKGYNNKLNVSKMINNICEFEPRSKFIVEQVKMLLNKEPCRRLIILSDRRNHLERLHQLLSANNIENAFYVGGMKQSELKESESKKVILATFHIASEGFDCPGLDTLILASPKSDVVQCVGRIQRIPQHLRKNIPLVIDIVDNFSLFAKQAQKRLKYYKSCKYDIDGADMFVSFQKVQLTGQCFIHDDSCC